MAKNEITDLGEKIGGARKAMKEGEAKARAVRGEAPAAKAEIGHNAPRSIVQDVHPAADPKFTSISLKIGDQEWSTAYRNEHPEGMLKHNIGSLRETYRKELAKRFNEAVARGDTLDLKGVTLKHFGDNGQALDKVKLKPDYINALDGSRETTKGHGKRAWTAKAYSPDKLSFFGQHMPLTGKEAGVIAKALGMPSFNEVVSEIDSAVKARAAQPAPAAAPKAKDPSVMSAVERAIARSEENAARLAKQGPQLLPTPAGGARGFQNESTLNAALQAQGKAEKGEAKPQKTGYKPTAQWTDAEKYVVHPNGEKDLSKSYIRAYEAEIRGLPDTDPTKPLKAEHAKILAGTRWRADGSAYVPALQAAADADLKKQQADAAAQTNRGKRAARDLSYKQALAKAQGKVGSVQGDPHLAVTAETLAMANRGLNPQMVYEGAKAKGITPSQLRKMSPIELGNLMFEKAVKGSNKVGAVAMVAAPVTAAVLAWDAKKSEAMAAGQTTTAANTKAATAAAGAGAATGAVMWGIGKGISLGVRAAAVAGAAAGAPALGAVAVAGVTAWGAYEMGKGAVAGYRKHGIKGAALGAVGADALLDRKAGFAAANEAYKAMQAAPKGEVRQFERDRRTPSGVVVHEVVKAHRRAS